MTFDRFGSATTDGTFAADMQRARGYKPFTIDDLTKAYSQYAYEGMAVGRVVKSATDEDLYNRAKFTVVSWWKNQKATAAAVTAPPATNINPATGVPYTIEEMNPNMSSPAGTSGNKPALTSSPSGGPSGSIASTASMPDTAMSPSSSAPPPGLMAGISSKVAIMSTYAQQREGAAAPDAPSPPLTAAQASATMRAMGAPTTWSPPAYALANDAALKDWVGRAAANSQMILAAGKAPAYNDTYVATAIKNLKITGVTAASVPAAYRTSLTSLNSYLLSRQAAAKLAAAKLQQQNAARMTRLL